MRSGSDSQPPRGRAFTVLVLGASLGVFCDGSSIDLLPAGVANMPGDAGEDRLQSTEGDCSLDDDCRQGTRCDPVAGRCVECLADADCESGLACDLLGRRCTEACTSNRDCVSWRWLCDDSRNLCVECITDSDCERDETEKFCLAGDCVECLTDADCHFRQPLCHPHRFRCRECLSDSDCARGQRCDSTGYCATFN